MEDLRPLAGQFQHLVEGDLVQFASSLHVPGIGGVDALHVGIDLAQVGLQGRRQGHCRGVGAAPAQGGDVVELVQALEAGDDDDGVVPVQLGLDALGVDGLDAGAAVVAVGLEARLPAGEGDHREAQGLDGHGAEGAGDLLSGGQQHIHLTLGRPGVDLLRLFDQVVGGVALGGQHRHHLVALAVGLRDDPGHVPQPLRVGH